MMVSDYNPVNKIRQKVYIGINKWISKVSK